jgi:glycosyltransferase involved in cell wall biosynthesis/GT2 family glycosyltransferase
MTPTSDDRRSDPLRIAFALPGLHRVQRGAEMALQNVAREIARLGHDVTVFGSGKDHPDEPYRFVHIPCIPRERFEKIPSIPFLRTHYSWEELTFAPGLWRRTRGGNFDASVTCGYPYTNWTLRTCSAKHVFITQNGDWMIRGQGIDYRFFDCDGLVCTNPQYFARHGERYPAALIPNGVDIETFSPANSPAERNRASYGLPPDGKIALMVSALIPSKRVIEGIRAAAGVDGLFLVVAGDGELRQQVDAEAARWMPGRYLRLSLPSARMPGLYRCADVVLHMSLEEPFGNVYTEALATGLPIVTHDWEGTRWALEDCASLVDCENEKAVTIALAQALADNSPEKIEKRGALVSRRFTWTKIAEQYADFLQRLRDPAGYAFPAGPSRGKLEDVGVVAIGRNEGDRLVRCLESVVGRVAAVVYVDSASDDKSVENAKRIGAEVVEFDKNVPFTAAMARNMGVKRLKELFSPAPGTSLSPSPGIPLSPSPGTPGEGWGGGGQPGATNRSTPRTLKYIQFVDGDCEVRSEWMDKARAALEADPKLAAVCGRRRERFAKKSMYNRLIDIEWNTPVGPAKNVGGDSMFRLEAFDSVGGFDPSVMAGEEPQLCLRIRHAGWTIRRIDAEMTLHDAAMTRFTQWWRRNVRAGYGTLDVNRRFQVGGERIYGKLVRSATMWAVGYPLAIALVWIIGGALFGSKTGAIIAAVLFAALPLQIIRQSLRSLTQGKPPRVALAYGFFTMLSKWAWFVGQVKYVRDRRRGRGLQLIEYKRNSTGPTRAIPVNPPMNPTGQPR